MVTKEKAKEIAMKKLPKDAKINGCTDYEGYYVFTFDVPNVLLHTALAVNKLTGIVKNFDVMAAGPKFIKEAYRQNT